MSDLGDGIDSGSDGVGLEYRFRFRWYPINVMNDF